MANIYPRDSKYWFNGNSISGNYYLDSSYDSWQSGGSYPRIPNGYHRMQARYTGKCIQCGGFIAEGSEIAWKENAGAWHYGCFTGGGPPPNPNGLSEQIKYEMKNFAPGTTNDTPMAKLDKELDKVLSRGRKLLAAT